MLRVCFNCYGNYTTDTVYQWDQNHVLKIIGLDLEYAPAVHFCNKKSSEAIVVQSEKVADGFTAPIPNILLQEPYNIIAYVHIYDVNEENAKTVEIVNIPLTKRVKPSEYQFEDNVEIKNFERLETDIADFIAKMEGEFEDYTSDTDAKYETFTTETTNNYTNFTNKVVKDYEYLKDETQSATGIKSGNVVSIEDSRKGRLVKSNIFGKSVQAGEPTPNKPVDIVSVDKNLVVKSCGKNLLDNTATTQTVAGITYTVNEDKSVTVNGTATESNDFAIVLTEDQITIPKGNYVLSGCPSGGSESGYSLLIGNYENNTYTRLGIDYGNSANISFDKETLMYCIIRIQKGITVNNLVFKPMIRKATITDSTYEPYQFTQATIPFTDSLRGIKVTSGGNYTDESGQQWLCDTLEKYADGSGKLVQRIYHKVFDGTESFTGNEKYYVYSNSIVKLNPKSNAITHSLCNKLVEKTPDYLWSNSVNGFSIDSTTRSIRFRVTNLANVTDKATLQAQLKEWYDNGEPLEVICERAEYIETPLTAEQVTELEKLKTFEPYTTIYTDDIGEIEVGYFKNNLNGEYMAEHNHDERYYPKEETDYKLRYKAESNHNHDERYCTRDEIGTMLDGQVGDIMGLVANEYFKKSNIAVLTGTATVDSTTQMSDWLYLTAPDGFTSDNSVLISVQYRVGTSGNWQPCSIYSSISETGNLSGVSITPMVAFGANKVIIRMFNTMAGTHQFKVALLKYA